MKRLTYDRIMKDINVCEDGANTIYDSLPEYGVCLTVGAMKRFVKRMLESYRLTQIHGTANDFLANNHIVTIDDCPCEACGDITLDEYLEILVAKLKKIVSRGA